MTPHDMVGAALSAAEVGLAVGELPIGAVVVMGDEVVGWAYTQDSSRNRRLVHADLLAMITADERLGWMEPQTALAATGSQPGTLCDVPGGGDDSRHQRGLLLAGLTW
jgi:tRNA(adenine34) deaminase